MVMSYAPASYTAPSRARPGEQRFDVEVTRDPASSYFTAVCGPLGLVTEAGNLDDLIDRARLIAPDLYELNGFGAGTFTLDFHVSAEVS
jgi:hypothetical protein